MLPLKNLGVRGAFLTVSGLALLSWLPAGRYLSQTPNNSRLVHPAIPLLDANGTNVIKSKGPISTRKTCGGCHDYDFITDSFHFQQGKNEMNPQLLASHGVAAYNASPGMYGKFSIIPNKQLAHQGITSPDDFDMGTPEWNMKCGACHTGSGMNEFDTHNRPYLSVKPSDVAPLDPDYHLRDSNGKIVPWDWQKSGIAEGDCFLCHVPSANRWARREAVGKGDFRWANNATLTSSGIVTEQSDGKFAYNLQAFKPDGTVREDLLNLSDPNLENCAQCHGFTAKNTTTIRPIQHGDIFRGTEKAGWIYNGAKISDTVSPHIVGKEKMDYPWDVHAAKNLICIDCHFSPNNPARKIQADAAKHLTYNPGGADLAAYLKRPDHNFARGNIPPETVNMTRHNTMRGCGDCHDTASTHGFLPYKELHFKRLACQTCHIPAVHFWAYRSDEWGFLADTGTSHITLRGIDGSLTDAEAPVTGFLPAYITTTDKNNNPQIRPTNLITGVYWFDKVKQRPLYTWQVRQALFSHQDSDGTWIYRPEILRAFDQDKDEILIPEEGVYDTPQKIALVREFLQKYAGIADPELRIEVVPWAMSHSTVGKGQAVKECTSCHAANSMLHRPMDLAEALPQNVPIYYRGAEQPVVRYGGKQPVFDNRPLLAGFYIIGNSRISWIEWLGWLSVIGTLMLVLIHSSLRVILGGRK